MKFEAFQAALYAPLREVLIKGEYLGDKFVDTGFETGDEESHGFSYGAVHAYVVIQPTIVSVWFRSAVAAGELNFGSHEDGYPDILEILAKRLREKPSDPVRPRKRD